MTHEIYKWVKIEDGCEVPPLDNPDPIWGARVDVLLFTDMYTNVVTGHYISLTNTFAPYNCGNAIATHWCNLPKPPRR